MYKCNECGYESTKWIGKCPHCGSWSIEELEEQNAVPKGSAIKTNKGVKLLLPDQIKETSSELALAVFGLSEVSRVLGKNVIKGGVYMLGGEPGVGKSTLLMQLALDWAVKGLKVAYISSEESEHQVLYRLKRILEHKGDVDGLSELQNLKIANTTIIEEAIASLTQEDIDIVIFDSVQGFTSLKSQGVVGGVSQIKEVAFQIVNFSKRYGVSSFVVGQVTKEGIVSGPKLLEHIVDVVSYLEYGGTSSVRIFRSTKNRFFEVGNLGFLSMEVSGFVDAPTVYEEWINNKSSNVPGVGFGVILYGVRPLIVQVQSLLVDSRFANPRRLAEGISKSRLELLLAIMQEHIDGIDLSYKDVFVKVLGGLNVKDPGLDLSIIASLLSAYLRRGFKNSVFIGEVGLLGNVTKPLGYKLRIKEAKQHGFRRIITADSLQHVSALSEYFKK